MDPKNAFEQQLSRVATEVAGPVRPVDATAVVRSAKAAPVHRWSINACGFRGGVTTRTEGSFSMFSALKFIAASAIVALFGGFLLTGVFTTQQGDEMVPAAATESASPMTAQMLEDMSMEGWNNDDFALLEESYAPDAVHTVLYLDGMSIVEGRAAVIGVAMSTMAVTAIAPIVELEAPDGELHWAGFYDLSSPSLSLKGVVCSLWARDDQIVRHDCILPMGCPGGVCTS
jgi:hypothetical protein